MRIFTWPFMTVLVGVLMINLQTTFAQDSGLVHYEKLIKLINVEIPGYERIGEPNGATAEVGGNSYSTATAEFRNGEGNRVTISLYDYKLANQMYINAAMVWAMGIKVDNPEEKAQSVEISDHIRGWESYKKKTKESYLILGVNDRYIFMVEAENQNIGFCHIVRKRVPLEELPE